MKPSVGWLPGRRATRRRGLDVVVVAGQLARRGVRRLPRSWAASCVVVAAELWRVIVAALKCVPVLVLLREGVACHLD